MKKLIVLFVTVFAMSTSLFSQHSTWEDWKGITNFTCSEIISDMNGSYLLEKEELSNPAMIDNVPHLAYYVRIQLSEYCSFYQVSSCINRKIINEYGDLVVLDNWEKDSEGGHYTMIFTTDNHADDLYALMVVYFSPEQCVLMIASYMKTNVY